MIITIIGGSGFIGSHVADKLSDEGHEVKLFDINPSKYLRNDQKMIIGNINNFDQLNDSIKGSEVVYHFAGISDLNVAFNKANDTAVNNILGSVKILESCVSNNVKRLIFASTVYVYSNEGGFYRCSKQAIEQYIQEFNNQFELEYTVLRFGSIYGPRSDSTNGLHRIIDKAINEKKITYHGNPEARREYIHVEDVADACVQILSDKFINQNIVLTGNQSMKVENVLKTIAEILNIKDKINFVDDREPGHYVTTPYNYIPRIGKKFNPTMHVDLGQGLLQLIDYISKKNEYSE